MRALLMKSKGGGAPITTAGIYWNSKEGIISLSSDGTNWTTIADKNLGATQVYNSGDTLSEANCGKYYQWGNNYGFPFTGPTTTSSSQVDASTYGPGNYYTSSTFIYGNHSWFYSQNNNLWGDTTDTNAARQGPCATGFHVPSQQEMNNLINTGVTLGALSLSNGYTIKVYLKMPIAGYIQYDSTTPQGKDVAAFYWTTTPHSDYNYCKHLWGLSSLLNTSSNADNADGMSIRPFANEPVQPDDGGDWSVLYTPPVIPDYLCFTAEQANSTVYLLKKGTPTYVTFEKSTDGINWSAFNYETIFLNNVGDKIYFRNTSETPTGFSIDTSNRYYFSMGGKVSASGDVNFLLCKNSTDTLISDYCFYNLFYNCTALTTAPKLTAKVLTPYCYRAMFSGCTNLEQLPKLPATTLAAYCYQTMFISCSKIKLSTTQTGEYQTPYRIPATGTGTSGTDSLTNMFHNTGGTFTGTPTINTTYYTSNTLV